MHRTRFLGGWWGHVPGAPPPPSVVYIWYGPYIKTQESQSRLDFRLGSGASRRRRFGRLLRCAALWQDAAKSAKMAVFRDPQKHPKKWPLFQTPKICVFDDHFVMWVCKLASCDRVSKNYQRLIFRRLIWERQKRCFWWVQKTRPF